MITFYLKYKEGNIHKFWNLTFKDLDSKEYTIHFGDYNTDGTKETLSVTNDLRRELKVIVRDKIEEGYRRCNREIVSASDLNVEELRKGLNPMYKLCAILLDDNDYYQFEKNNGILKYIHNDGSGNGYELVLKDQKAILRDFDHENVFGIAEFSTLLFDWKYLVYDGADKDLLKELDTDDLTYGMWTNDGNEWFENKLFAEDFTDKYLSDKVSKENEFYPWIFNELNREEIEDIIGDNFELELPDEVLDIVFKDEPITKKEVIKIIELLEDEDGCDDIISLDKVDEVVELLFGMYDDSKVSSNSNDNSIYLEFKDDKSSKFWKVEYNDSSYTVTYGKIGATGTSKTTESDNSEAEARKQANAKIKKGYVEIKVKPKAYLTDKEESVSIWFTNFEGREIPMDYLEFVYPDEDSEDKMSSSVFTREFDLFWYDEDFAEAYCLEESTNDYSLFFEDHEYEDEILERLDEITKHLNNQKFTGVIILGDTYCKNIKPKSDDGLVVFAGSLDFNDLEDEEDCEELSAFQKLLNKTNKNELYGEVIMCINAKGVTIDEDEIWQLLERLYELGYNYVYADIGVAWQYGKGISINHKNAVKAYLKGIDRKDEYSMNNLGCCYRDAEGVDKDLNQAGTYFKMAIEHNHINANNNLACLYSDKEYDAYNLKEAFELWTLGYGKNGSSCAVNIGDCYEYGTYVDIDYEKALFYYKRAVELGWMDAQKKYDELKSKMNNNKENNSNSIYLELKDDKSSKFWKVEYNDASYTVTYGKIGSKGTSKTTDCDNPEVEARKQANAKIKKGYVEVSVSNNIDNNKNNAGYIQIKIEDNDDLSIKDSKFGGLPFIPRGFELPTSNLNDGPLFLLAQINLSELPKGAFPIDKGFLQFYIDGEDDMYGIEFGDPIDHRGYRVIYLEDSDDYYDEDELEDIYTPNTDEVPIDNAVGLVFKKALHSDGPGHRILGEPFFTQYDPRDEDEETILLFQIDTDSTGNVEICFGDSGVMNFFMTQEELDNKDFTNVLANWDCF